MLTKTTLHRGTGVENDIMRGGHRMLTTSCRLGRLEPLLKQFGVDLVIWAHEHSYERTWPLYDNKVYNGSLEQPYVNPGAPVHIVTGSAGCQENTSKFNPHPPAWSAFRSSDYGFTRFYAFNKTHIYLEQVSVDQHGDVIDSFWIEKAPVHIVTGSAGCQENTDPFVAAPPEWSAFRSTDYGYTRFHALNKTHIYMEQVSVDKKGEVIDSFWLQKSLHEPYKMAPVHIVTGSAGCQEGRDRFRRNPFKWSAFQSQDYGYTRFKAFNKTHLYLEQVSVDLGGQVIDSFWMVKNKGLSFNEE
ncbi:unnamed protein product [Plutella xylostella]|uniref:(diamondback moth) hypothetical protein n=1 Tax=Plutella xylostella TaxID=51655 RepID=A0A8S4DIL2_PLUXY|nr:unnamed protein product [Plutella xylostella]